MSSKPITFILVIAVVCFSLVLAVEGILGLAHKLNKPDPGAATAPRWVARSIHYRAKKNRRRDAT